MLTYREQSYVLAVSPLWHSLILGVNDEDLQEAADKALSLSVKAEIEYGIFINSSENEDDGCDDVVDDALVALYEYLASPVCRGLFIHPDYWEHKHTFIIGSTSNYYYSHMVSEAITALYRKVDSCNLKLYLHGMEVYWVLTHEQALIERPLSFEMFE